MSNPWWEDPDECERVEVAAYPEEWYHLHGKAMSGLRHSHPLRNGEDQDNPWHDHEGEFTLPHGGEVDRRGVGVALYPAGDTLDGTRPGERSASDVRPAL